MAARAAGRPGHGDQARAGRVHRLPAHHRAAAGRGDGGTGVRWCDSGRVRACPSRLGRVLDARRLPSGPPRRERLSRRPVPTRLPWPGWRSQSWQR
jgi:hypothetical protein